MVGKVLAQFQDLEWDMIQLGNIRPQFQDLDWDLKIWTWMQTCPVRWLLMGPDPNTFCWEQSFQDLIWGPQCGRRGASWTDYWHVCSEPSCQDLICGSEW
jgi:hypothetical protein